MANLVSRDQKHRKMFKAFELKRVLYNSIVHDLSLPLHFRNKISLKNANLPRKSARVKIRNRCILTGRGKGVYQKFKISRITFRELASKGLIPGVTKSSW